MIAPKVSPSALPRFVTKLFGSSCSWATWMPVMSAAIPPDALQSASAIAMTSVIETPARSASMIDVSWKTRKSWTSLRERRRDVLDLSRHVARVGDESVDRDERDERRHEGQEGVERDAGGDQREVVLPETGSQLRRCRAHPGSLDAAADRLYGTPGSPPATRAPKGFTPSVTSGCSRSPHRA